MPGRLGVHPICFHTVTAFVTLLQEKHLGEPSGGGRQWHGQGATTHGCGHQALPPEPPAWTMLPPQGTVLCHQLLLGSKAELWQTVCCPQQWWWQRVRRNPQVSWCLSALRGQAAALWVCSARERSLCPGVLHLTTASCTPNKKHHL